MSEYPEHDKLSAVKDESQAIGEFLDFGLPRLGGGMAIYEKVAIACECSWCVEGAGRRSSWHSEEEKESTVDGVVQVQTWQPTYRSIQTMLAEYFEIDQAKLDAEKEAMLDAIRSVA